MDKRSAALIEAVEAMESLDVVFGNKNDDYVNQFCNMCPLTEWCEADDHASCINAIAEHQWGE